MSFAHIPGAASCKKSIRKNNPIRKNKSTRRYIVYLKMCFLVDLFFLIDFYMKRPLVFVYKLHFFHPQPNVWGGEPWAGLKVQLTIPFDLLVVVVHRLQLGIVSADWTQLLPRTQSYNPFIFYMLLYVVLKETRNKFGLKFSQSDASG